MLSEKIAAEKWGAKILQQIADDLQKQLPGLRGFSHRSLKNMRQLAAEYAEYINDSIGQLPTGQLPSAPLIGQSPTAQLENFNLQVQDAFFGISFTHHILIINKCKRIDERLFYISQAASQCWSVLTLEHHILANLFKHQGKLSNNFKNTLPENVKASALQVFQDEYLFDFIAQDGDNERVFEGKIVSNIKDTIMALGKGFSFIANQFRLEVDGEEFFIDLLFFNRNLQCLVAFELKRGKFKPEYAGQLNFYLNVLDEKVRLANEQASIGIVLCKEKNNTIVEYAVKTIDKAMGVATYRTSKELPREMRNILPNAAELAKLL